MATTPLWIPLAAAAIAVVGTLGGVIFTQAWNSRLEERRWAREAARLAEAQAREDLYRTYEHRRAAYVDFLVEFERLQHIYQDSDREPTTFDDPAFDSLAERLVAVRVYGTVMAHALALDCLVGLQLWALHPENPTKHEGARQVGTEYLAQIRKDLGVPEWEPAAE